MIKSLIDNDKPINDRREGDATSPKPAQGGALPQTDLSTKNFGAYGAQMNHSSQLNEKNWDNDRTSWSGTPQGRLAIRTISRGVVGAAFFASGGLLTKKWMGGYDSEKVLIKQNNPLQFIAKLIDTVAGKPIEGVISLVNKDWGMRSVRFRQTQHDGDFAKTGYHGRSLGNEVVNITFDFFSASIGDAWARDIAGWFDPHVKKDWIKDGRFDFPEAVKSTLKSAGRYVTYNGGEDWAVAIPYAYYMKAQRAVINKISPGFMYDFDRGLNGASFKVDNKGKVTGSFALAGAADLQGRFTAYNIGTLMYREGYDYVADRILGRPHGLYGDPSKPKEKLGVFGGIAYMLKWTARSIVKGGIYMTPAVPAFWISRVHQHKNDGMMINPEKGMMAGIFEGGNIIQSLRPFRMDSDNKQAFFAQYDPKHIGDNHWTANLAIGRTPSSSEMFKVPYRRLNAYEQGVGRIERSFDWIGNQNDRIRNKAKKPIGWLDKKLENLGGKQAKNFVGIGDTGKWTDLYVDAAVSYTPYMYAKAEASRAWDTGKMDMAAERMIDGATSFNFGEFKAGAGEVFRTILHKPLADPAREAEGQHRIKVDPSPSVDVALPDDLQPLNWMDRVISSKPPTKEKENPLKEASRTDESRKKKPRKSASYAEQEELRKALDELKPPSNSIH